MIQSWVLGVQTSISGAANATAEAVNTLGELMERNRMLLPVYR